MWFQRVNLTCFAVHIVSSIVVLALGLEDSRVESYKLPVVTSYTTNGTVVTVGFAAAPLLPLVVIPGMISAVGHLVLAFSNDAPDIPSTGINPMRWEDYSLSSAIMMVAIALLCGVADLWQLCGIALSQWFLMLCSGAVEATQSALTTAQQLWATLIMSAFYGVTVWGPVFYAFHANSPPDFVVAIVTTLFVLYGAFGVVYSMAIVRWFDAEKTEVLYATLSIVAKVTLQWLVYGGIAARTNSGTTQALAIVVPVVLGGGAGVGAVFWNTAPGR